MSEHLPTTLLEDAIDIPVWLEADASKSLRERMKKEHILTITNATMNE